MSKPLFSGTLWKQLKALNKFEPAVVYVLHTQDKG